MPVTPIECTDGGVYLKRDDLFVAPGGARGGKARTCEAIVRAGFTAGRSAGIITAGSRSSPQVNIVARLGAAYGVPVRVHTPTGTPGPEVAEAVAVGAERVTHAPGYNTVIVRRALEDAAARPDWTYVPFGMETSVAVDETADQAALIPVDDLDVRRIVVPVGSGMSLAGIIEGVARWPAGRWRPPVLGVVVGADPTRRLDTYAPRWRGADDLFGCAPDVRLVETSVAYDRHVTASIGGVSLDPVYEAKCVPFLRPGDLLWIVGIRPSMNDTVS